MVVADSNHHHHPPTPFPRWLMVSRWSIILLLLCVHAHEDEGVNFRSPPASEVTQHPPIASEHDVHHRNMQLRQDSPLFAHERAKARIRKKNARKKPGLDPFVTPPPALLNGVVLGRHPVWCSSSTNSSPVAGSMNASSYVADKIHSLKTKSIACTQPENSRLANGLIVYAVCRIVADSLHIGVRFDLNGRSQKSECHNLQANYFPSMVDVQPPVENEAGRRLASRAGTSVSQVLAPCPHDLAATAQCKGYFQSYNLLRGHQALVQSYMRPGPDVLSRNTPGDDDIVVHLRLQLIQPPIEFYTALFALRRSVLGPIRGTIWLVSEDHKHEKVVALARRLNARIRRTPRGCGSAEDMAFLMAARRLVLSWGSYSWFAGFVSSAVEIHLPIGGDGVLKHWVNTAFLFVDDDPRYIFHDHEKKVYFMSAAEVILEGGANDEFIDEVRKRPFDRIHAQPGGASDFPSAETGLVQPCRIDDASKLASSRGYPYPVRGAVSGGF